MKKVLAICMLWTTVFALNAQNGDLEKQTYFRIGYSLPSWKYYGYDGQSDWNENFKRTGAILEYGNIFMLNSIKLAPGMRIGINVDYISLNYHRFKINETDDNYNFLYFGSKVGPSFSYSPVNKLVFDAYVKFNPVWAAGEIDITADEAIDDDLFIGFMGIKYSVGLNVRYSLLMVGFEFNPGFTRFRYYDPEENELTDDYRGNVNDNNDRTPVPAINFTLGLCF